MTGAAVLWCAGTLLAADPNRVPNPFFEGTGGLRQGTLGVVPDRWRAFAVGGGAAETSIVPLAAHALYPGSPAVRAVRLKVTAFGQDQGYDHDAFRFPVTPGESYHVEFFVKTGNADGSTQRFNVGFPLFAGGVYLRREPGGRSGLTAAGTWTRIVGPTFTDAEATAAHISFRLANDGGENAVLIALPMVGDPPDRFPPPAAAELAERPSWHACDRLVATTYFYWYRWPDMHFFDDARHTDDALTDHFPSPTSVSMLSKAWHKKELADMIDAGIDMAWPVYWAAPGNFDSPHYSLYVLGLLPMQEARDELLAEGRSPPRIGMFYDTSSLLNSVRGAQPYDGKADLITPEGKDIFYGTIRSFFSTVRPRHWACIDGRPVVVLYASAFAARYDQSSIDHVYARFAADFGGIRPYIIRERSWSLQTESDYRWGAALSGPRIDGIAAVGPGYDDSAVPGRTTPKREREGGAFYASGWLAVRASNVAIAHVETWNEMHEGTDVCESVEYGRQYMDLTRQHADAFRARGRPLQIIAMSPLPRVKVRARPAAITVAFSAPVLPGSVNGETFRLWRCGDDGRFGTEDDVAISAAAIIVDDDRAVFDLTGVALPPQTYRVALTGAGEAPITDFCGRPLAGHFGGSFPSGADGVPADFAAVFYLMARADFDADGDVDLGDFTHLRVCFNGPNRPPLPIGCSDTDLDADGDCDLDDFGIFQACFNGPNRPAACSF